MRYAVYFALSVIGLTTGTVLAFDRISTIGMTVGPVGALPSGDTLPGVRVVTPAAPTAADYARFADADAEWRRQNAREYTLAELRTRGDGRRTSRDSVEDRVFAYVRTNQRGRAIAELERWVASHPADRELLLSLARLLSEDGRSDDAIGRYRQVLALRR